MRAQIVLSILQLANRVLSSAILITAFSLGVYIFRHNVRSSVGRAFCILLASVMVVYLGDVAILWTQSAESALTWLKFQWVGIAFVPSVYLHFSDALLKQNALRARNGLAALPNPATVTHVAPAVSPPE